ncbi:MAG: TPM domain-containing protein, partial [Actinomycetaceae bacterium]|nr:TPM domain-containing protein [Actinomycetaceae bacterium]
MSYMRKTLAAALLLSAGLFSASPAWGEEPTYLNAVVVDKTGTIDASEITSLTEKIADLEADSDKGLYIIVVDDFSGYASNDWTERTAEVSNLSQKDTLIALATETRQYGYTYGSESFSDGRINLAIDKALDDWKNENWEEGLEAIVDYLQDSYGSNKGAAKSGDSSVLPALLSGTVVAGVVGGTAYALTRERRRKRALAAQGLGPDGKPIDIATQAGSA